MMHFWVKALYYKNLMKEKVSSWLNADNGATVAEYALVLALVVVALIVALGGLREALSSKIEALTKEIEGIGW